MEELNKKSRNELMKELDVKKLSLRDVRFNASGGKARNVMETRNTKRDIARINTVLKTKAE